MSADNAADSVAAILAAQPLPLRAPTGGTLALVRAASLFLGPVRATVGGVQPVAVFCLNAGGIRQPYCGTGGDWLEADVQVTVRGAADAFERGEALAQACIDRLQRAASADWLPALVGQASPMYLGPDETGRHLFALHALLRARRG